MRSDEIKALPSTERIKAVAGKWRDLSAFGKKRYEAKKEKLLKDYKKEIDKYRKVRHRRQTGCINTPSCHYSLVGMC